LDFHCKNNSVATCLFSDSTMNGPVPGTKERPKKYRDFSAIVPETNQLLFLSEEEDFGASQDFDEKFFRSFSKILLTSKFKDIHIYALKSSVMNILNQERDFCSIKADLIPYLLRGQYSNKLEVSAGDACRCFAYLCTTKDASLIGHCNNVAAYFEANRDVQRVLKALGLTLASRTKEDLKSSSGANTIDSYISAKDTQFGEKSLVKKSVIGDNCKIGANVKIESSLLMNGVVVENGAVIKSSILFPDVTVGEKADVGMCIISTSQKVNPKSKLKEDTLDAEREMLLDD